MQKEIRLNGASAIIHRVFSPSLLGLVVSLLSS